MEIRILVGRWTAGGLLCLAVGLAACVQTVPKDLPLVDRVLAEKTLRAQLIERGAADPEFVHEILHQFGQETEGNERLAKLLAEHLAHHPATARAVFQELATHQEFQDWLMERLSGPEKTQ